MSSSNDFQNFLESKDYSLEQQLKIVLSTFTATDLYSTKNKESVLLWIKQKLLEEDKSENEQKLIYSVFKQCIANATDVLLRPQLPDLILAVILGSSQSLEELLDCFVELLNSIHFLKYFVYHVQKMTDVILSFMQKLNERKPNNEFKIKAYGSILNAILKVKINIMQINDFTFIFVEHLIEVIAVIVNDVKNSNVLEFDFHLVQNIFYQVLFHDTEFRNSFTRNLFLDTVVSDSDPEKHVINVIQKIINFRTHLKLDILATSYSLIFSGFLLSNSNYESKFEVFVALNSYMFVRPLSIDERNQKSMVLNENMVITNALIELLLKFDLPLDTQMQTKFTLMDWLSAFIDSILDKSKINMNGSLLKLLQNCFTFSPILIENSLKKFTKTVMLTKKANDDTTKSYSDLCLYVLNVHVKLNRMHKLISALLITVKENLLEFASENVPGKFDVLPEEIFDRIQTAVTNLPSTVQNVALLNTLLYHLEKDCIHILEQENSKQVDVRLLLLFDIVAYLIARFITGTRVADHSVPEMVKDKFILLMDNLASLLGRFGKAIISKEHISKLAECFLHMCLVWGDMQLVFMVYESSPRKVPKQAGVVANSPTNLVYLHPYLSDYHWKLIAQRVVNFGDESCVNLLNDLVLQKIHALPYLEDEIQGPYVENVYDDGPAVVCAHYLSNQADAKWLFHHVSEFVHLLKPVDVLMLSKALVNYCQMCDEEEMKRIFSADFREMRSLVIAMLCYTFHSLSKKFAKYNLKELKRILRRIDYEEMLKVELEEDEDEEKSSVKSVESTLDEIGSILSDDFRCIEEKISGNFFKKDLCILTSLPAQYLRCPNKSVICLLTFSLLKNLIKLTLKNPDINNMLIESSKFLQGILKNVNIPKSVDCGKILAWLYRGLKDTPYCDLIMQRFCELSKNYGSEIESVIDIVKAINTEEESDVFIESKSDGVDLVASYLVNLEKIRKRKHTNGDSEVKRKLMKLCYKNFDEVFLEVSMDFKEREKKLALYTLLFHETMKSGDKNQLELLTVHLLDFVQIAEEYIDTKSETISRFLLVLLKYHKEIKTWLPKNFLIDLWCSNYYTLEKNVICSFLKVAASDDYNEMIKVLSADTEGSLHLPDEENLKELCRLWKIVIDTPVKELKTKFKKKAIPGLCNMAQKFIVAINSDSSSNETSSVVMKMFLKIFISLLRNTQISLPYNMLDVCFDLISCITAVKYDEELLLGCTELLFVFGVVRTPLLLDRIPSFYLCYKSLYIEIVRKCNFGDSCDIDLITSAAHKLEKLTDTFVKHKKDFAKTAISAIADFINIIAVSNINDPVKNHLKNIIYCWIGICDSHGLEHLSSTLSSVSQNLFKQYWSDYSKYYKFSGKV